MNEGNIFKERVVKGRGAFTLIEIVIILLVLGIISAVAIPKFVNLAETANRASEEYTVGAIREGLNLKQAEDAVQ